MNPSFLRRWPALRAAAGLAAAFAACSCSTTGDAVTGTGTAGGTTPPATPDVNAHLRIVQVVSDATEGVDVRLNGAAALGGLPFGLFFPYSQGDYQTVPATPQVAFNATGSSVPFYNQVPSPAAAGAYATLVAFGRVSSQGPVAATVVAISDTSANAPAAALVRVFNTVDYLAAATGSPVDVYVYVQGNPRPGAPDVAALPWGARSAYLVKGTGVLQVDVFAAGGATGGPPLFTGTVPTQAGSIRTLVLADPAPSTTTGSVVVLYDFK